MTPEIAAELHDLDARCFPHRDDKRERFDRGIWWLASEDGRMVGYAAAAVDEHVLYLTRAGVLPEARGRGLQRRLIRARVQHARRLGLTRCYTYTVPWNWRSTNNLIDCGFRLWLPARPWATKNCLYFFRRLD
jgi:GNAT superfamily N-acetyltransferase